MLLFTIALGLTLITAFLLHCDDTFLDLYALWKRLEPRKISPQELKQLTLLPQRRLALLIPTWQEPSSLEQMVQGNLERLRYENYSVFLGVYPNDLASWEAARRLEKKFPHLSVIVNHQMGPTSKAQLLNHMIASIVKSEKITGVFHEGFLIQDLEDVIHPLALATVNKELETADLVQLPLLSLPVSWKQFTAGTYADETAESHTKDLLARHALGNFIPNASSGLAVSRTLLTTLLNEGSFLSENNAAETYHLAMRAGRFGFKASFLSTYIQQKNKRDFIATRKFFPEKAKVAVGQKARWATEIAFQVPKKFGWSGTFADQYFLWRDRRGTWTTIFLTLASFLFLISAFQGEGEIPLLPRWMEILSLINLLLLARRLLWRMRTTAWVHGWAYALLVPVRWPVGNFINSLSAWRALSLYRTSLRTGRAPEWIQRSRRLPSGF